MTGSVQIPCDGDHGTKPWVAKIIGRHPKKLYKREFLGVSPYVTKPGIYEATERNDKRSYYAVAHAETGDLVRVRIAASLLVELVDGWLHRMDQIVADPNKPSGKLRDDEGNIRVRSIAPSPATDIKPVDNAALIAELREALANTLSLLRAFTTDDDDIARMTRQQAEAALSRGEGR